MKNGEIVSWRSQSTGIVKRKAGKIIAVIPPFHDVSEVPAVRYGRWKLMFDGTGFRNHESYLVAVGGLLYWPRVRHLEKV